MGTTLIPTAQAVGSRNPAGVMDTPVVSDLTNGHYFQLQGGDILVAYNKGAGSVDVTLKAVADARQGRVEDEVHSIAAGDFLFCGPFRADGWKQSGGEIDVEVDTDTDVVFNVIRTAGVL